MNWTFEWLCKCDPKCISEINSKDPHSNINQSLICNTDLGGVSVGRTAPSKPPYASHTLVQINQNSQPKIILLKSYFHFDRMQIRYFCEKLREHYLVQRCWYSRQNHPTLMASKIAVIRKSDSMDPMNLFSSDVKVTCHISRIVYISIYEMDSKVIA